MLELLIIIGRALAMGLRGHRELVLENLAADGPDVRHPERTAAHPSLGRSALAREMATANPLWGAPRIHGELRTLGIDVSVRTVSRLLKRRPRPPSQTWRTFLTNHIASAASMDFFTVPTPTGRVLFVVVVLSHQIRHLMSNLLLRRP